MRHLNKLKKLNRTKAHRKALLMNMAVAMIKHERMKTTLPKAKVLKPFVERLVTKARSNDIATKRYLFSILKDNEIVNKLISDLGPRNEKRPGGYLRILKMGFRTGDKAPMAYMEFVEQSKPATKKKSKSSSATTKEVTSKQVSSSAKGSAKAEEVEPEKAKAAN